MPDTDHIQSPPPADWGSAFAALPMETPPAGGWQRLSRELRAPAPITTRRTRWPMWLAAAAVLSAAAVLPQWRREAPAPAVTPVATTPPPATPLPSATPPSPSPTAAADTTATLASTAPAPRAPMTETAAKPKPSTAPRKRRPPTSPQRDAEPQRMIAVADSAAQTAAADALAMQALQAESAQLEAVVALARDERVASASGAALTGELDDRIGRIDASLSQPGLGDAERTDLWRQRVSAMRELAGVETTQRWLLTQGERYDGALVSVD